MRIQSFRRAASFAAVSCAVALTAARSVAQSTPSRLDVDTGELFAPVPRERFADERLLRLAQDDPDYSTWKLFQDLHGSFVQNAFPYQPNLRIAYEQQLETEVKSDPGTFQWQSFRGDAYLPVVVDPDRMLLLGATGRMRRYDFSPSSPVPGNEDLHEFSALLGLGWFLQEDVLVQLKLLPGVYSDLDGTLNHRDWQFYGDASAIWRADESLFLTFGVASDETFEDLAVYPLFGVSWLIGESFRVDMLLPRNLEFSWLPSASWIWSVGIDLDGDEFNVRAPGTKQQFAVHTQEFRAYVETTLRMNDNLGIYARGGSTLFGQYNWAANATGGGLLADLRGTQDPAVFFEVGMGLNF
ncbi:MAG: hypothetical protein HZB39_09235 [Planctomycetes bacterium]|nr:hypothetical protein [Planctomycetota bacterium]